MATIGNIAVSLTARTAEFTKRIKGAEKTLRVWSRKVKRSMNAFRRSINNAFSMRRVAMGAAVAAGAMAYLVKRGIDAGDMLDKMSKRTGLSIKFLAGLRHAANLGGNSIDDMEKGVRKMTQAASDAGAGLKTYLREFDKLGVSVKDANGQMKTSETLFLEVATALSKVENSTDKVAIASKIFGRAGTRLLPMLTEGKRGLVAMMKEADALGNVWNSKTTKAAADAKDEMARLELVIASLKDRLAVGLIPKISEIAMGMSNWYKQNRVLVDSKIDRWADSVAMSLGNVWETLSGWVKDRTFELWWKRAQLAVMGFKVVLAGLQSSLEYAAAGYHKLAMMKAELQYSLMDQDDHKGGNRVLKTIARHQKQYKALTSSAGSRSTTAVTEYRDLAQQVAELVALQRQQVKNTRPAVGLM